MTSSIPGTENTGKIGGMKAVKKNPHAQALGRKGGPARARALSPQRRSEIARAAALARWAKNVAKLLLAVLLVGGGSRAQQAAEPDNAASAASAACPASILSVEPAVWSLGGDDPWGYQLRIRVRNTGRKTITVIKAGVDFLDATLDVIESAWDYTASHRMAPGEEFSPRWNDGVYARRLGSKLGARVYLLRVMFEDGTVWADDGLHSCAASGRGRLSRRSRR